jgi:hypothetical protein
MDQLVEQWFNNHFQILQILIPGHNLSNQAATAPQTWPQWLRARVYEFGVDTSCQGILNNLKRSELFGISEQLKV